MNIEFHTPKDKVKEWIVDFVREKVMEMHRLDKEISKAQIYFRELLPDEKLCEIELTIYGDSLFVHRKAGSYEEASRLVLSELAQKVEEQVRKNNEPPDEITSTVKV